MLTTETEILAILRNLPQPALEEAKIFLDFLAWRYQNTSPKGATLIANLRGKATGDMTTDEILNLTRGEE
ncbi:transcriptional regulator [Phormidium sp. CCY1219]|uniref:transcriptional regulator n=1 Tax=Phormidium sp. CCY1219 TaxID=2886104 RepID=UPI0007C3CB4D|nr:transcriptional regulator [Phormidium sp. CCY1219]MEB3831503.1 transcriptional regulator [Phormidium sp. CCY1219]OAB57451.1 transcriptional regulator [Phormidium willei BDU 130791]